MLSSRSKTEKGKMSHSSKGTFNNEKPKDDDKYKDSSGTVAPVWQDRISIAVLLLLYTLQGIPMGLCESLPLLLREKGVSYEALSLFSLVSLPFSLKILWAPLVDSYYFPKFGRRKSWIIPVQLLTGVVMLIGSNYMRTWLGTGESEVQTGGADDAETIPITFITLYFFFLYFLMATQDIAVDGWALTMLSRANVGYASICNSIGQALGVFLSNQAFLALSDNRWCEKHLGLAHGTHLLDLADFMIFWGYVFIFVTLLIWLFKREEKTEQIETVESFTEACSHIVSICKLPNVIALATIILTARIALAAMDNASTFKLQEYGMSKADIAMISPILLCMELILPALISQRVLSHPLDVFLLGQTVRILLAIPLMWGALQYIHYVFQHNYDQHAELNYFDFFLLLGIMMINKAAGNINFISMISFYSKISDPSIGGTYMTFLNALSNLSFKWTGVLSLWLLPKLTWKSCMLMEQTIPLDGTCDAHHGKECHDHGGICVTIVDGYTILMIFGFCFGIFWLYTFHQKIRQLQTIPASEWLISAVPKK